MDISALIAAVTTLMTPVLPGLVNAAEEGATDIARKAAAESWDALVRLWKRLTPTVLKDETSKSIVSRLADAPDDDDAQAAFRMILRGALQSDPQLTADLAAIVGELATQGSQIGERISGSISVGGNAKDSTLVVGGSVRVTR